MDFPPANSEARAITLA